MRTGLIIVLPILFLAPLSATLADPPKKPLEVETKKEFPAELKAIDTAILQWRDEVEFSLAYRFTVALGRSASSDPSEMTIVSLDDVKAIFSEQVLERVTSPAYPMVAIGKVLKRRDALLFSFNSPYTVLGVGGFDVGWANGVSVHLEHPRVDRSGRTSLARGMFASGTTADGSRKYPNQAGSMPMPLFGFGAVGVRVFQSEYRKGEAPTYQFYWGVKRDSADRLTVVQRRTKVDGTGKEQLLQQWEVTLRRDSKYPMIELSRFWLSGDDGKLEWSGDTRYSSFRPAGEGVLFPTRVESIRRVSIPRDDFADSNAASDHWYSLRIWEATEYAPAPPPKDAFRISLPPGITLYGYRWDPTQHVIDLYELDPSKLDRPARVSITGRPNADDRKSAAGGRPVSKSDIQQEVGGRWSTRRWIVIGLAIAGAALLVAGGLLGSRRNVLREDG